MTQQPSTGSPPEIQWARVTGPGALRPLDRNWVGYVRLAFLAAAVLIAWRILAWQEEGYRDAAESAALESAPVAAETGAAAPGEALGTPLPAPALPAAVSMPIPTPTPTPTPTPQPTPTPITHRVRTGDTLSEIGEVYDVSVAAILALNRIPNPNNLLAGTELVMPPDARPPASRPRPRTYVVQPGDTLSGIAVRFGVSLPKMLDENRLTEPNNVTIGQELRIPGGSS
ncbi:MAG: LysM peptidoglycan-binding domain-containing protein [Actinobacteria bacterium]|nr:LysM peptidoglycan-binding domain-containing protein [Actinomycetota bacterium]